MRMLAVLTLVVGGAVAIDTPASAQEQDRFTILEENDSLYFNSDKHYTQGLRLSDLRPALARDSAWNGPYDLLGSIAPVFASGGTGDYAVFLGQSIFTPRKTTIN